MLGGGSHALAALIDTVRPTYFAPIEASVKPALEGTGIRLRRMFPWNGGDGARPSMWRAWLGFNISHGLGVFTFGFLCLLIATHDFKLVEDIDAVRPLTIVFSAAYLALSLRFWFYGPAILTGDRHSVLHGRHRALGPRMRLPNTAHTSRPWRIHELTNDFRLEDVWALPTPGGPDDFPRLVRMMAAGDPGVRVRDRVQRLWSYIRI